MISYSPAWDLTTIPDDAFKSERGRRNASKRDPATLGGTIKTPCRFCGAGPYTASERRKCPNCGKNERTKGLRLNGSR